MIRNIIFDMGGVLVHYDPEHFVDLLSVSAEDKALLMREVFRTVAWFRMDRGTMGEAEAAASMKANLPPRLHGAADRLMAWWELELRPMEGMEDLVRELKELGCGVYLLSNATLRQPEYFDRLPVSRYMDGRMVSASAKYLRIGRAPHLSGPFSQSSTTSRTAAGVTPPRARASSSDWICLWELVMSATVSVSSP